MKTKRLTAVVLCVLMLTGIFSVTAQAAQKTDIGMIDVKVSNNTQFVTQYSQVLETIYQGVINHDESINISSYRVSSSEFYALCDALVDIYPELFFVENYSGSIRYNYISEIMPHYFVDKTTADTMLGEFYTKADEYLSMVDDTMDDFTKALVLHDQLAINNAYSIYNPDGSGEYSSNYTFMVNGWGRCENYAECYAYLLAQLGIKSEIINSESMVHEWMKICLGDDEYYYNVDLTWDDPTLNGEDRPGKVAHTYFLLSDEQFRTASELEQREQHYDYETLHVTDDEYDDYSNLHTLDNPLFYINGEFYTLYTKNNKGYIATYDYATDELTDKYEISDIWYAGSIYSYWIGNFSGIGERDGLLYFNGENTVYVYNPATNQASILMSNALTDGNKLYGMYMKDKKIIGLEAPDPNTAGTEVDLLREITYTYNVYDEAAQKKVEQSVKKVVKVNGMADNALAEFYRPYIKSAYLEYGVLGCNADGGIIDVQISDTPKIYTVDFNGISSEHSYMDFVTLNSDENCSFVIDGKVVHVGTSYSFFVGADTTVTTAESQAVAAYSLINLNGIRVNDDNVELDMLATANVGEGTYQRMGVALALSEKSKTEIERAVKSVATGSGTSNKIFVHNSSVNYANRSGQYQFRYAPYFSKSKANDKVLYFYTYVVTEDGVEISEKAQYDMNNLLA
ncbi:MAG: hypothetical protein K6F88_03740 [Ruminococcus sp.]|nr:hypothetical protein [Ruminococcus sp.]